MMILLDTNEVTTAPGVTKQLQDFFGMGSVIPASLPTADLAITLDNNQGILRVERKTPEDFCSSIADGRLTKQVDAMVKSGAWSAVVVTGDFRYESETDLLCLNGKITGWHGTSIRGAVRAIQWAGCLIEWCAPGHYARTVNELIRFASKPSHIQYHPTARKRKPLIDFYPDETIRQERIEFLMGLPGIGPQMARSLLDWCGSRDQQAAGSIADALAWITLFPHMERGGLPENWSPKKAVAARDFIMGDRPGVITLTHEKDNGKEPDHDHEQKA